MSTKIYANARFGFREDTLENWSKNNPILEKGEPAVVRDGVNGEWLKIGDGITDFNRLPWKKGPKGEQGIQGIKGDKGEQGIQGVAGKDAVTDQTYDPNSPNAQSGKAVSEALSLFTPKQKNYELIATIKVVPDVDGNLPTSIIFTEDSNGNPFELTDFFLVMTAGCTDGNTGLYLNANNSTVIGNVTVGFKSDGLRVSTFYFNCNKDIITVSVSTSNATPYWYSNQLGMARTLNIPLKAPTAYNLLPVTRVSVSAPLGNAKTWIDGSNFELWGVRK